MAVEKNAAGVTRGELTIVPAEHGGFMVYGSNDLCDYNRRLPAPMVAGSLDEVLGWMREHFRPQPAPVGRTAA